MSGLVGVGVGVAGGRSRRWRLGGRLGGGALCGGEVRGWLVLGVAELHFQLVLVPAQTYQINSSSSL